jgi:hypothetical protein
MRQELSRTAQVQASLPRPGTPGCLAAPASQGSFHADAAASLRQARARKAMVAYVEPSRHAA